MLDLLNYDEKNITATYPEHPLLLFFFCTTNDEIIRQERFL